MFLSVLSVGKNSESESLWGIKPHTFGLCSDALPLNHRDTVVSKVYYKGHMTCVLKTAGISNVHSIMFVNWIREIVSFELGKEIKKDVFHLSWAWDKEKFWVFKLFFLCSTHSWQTKNIFPHFFKLSSKLTISQILFMLKFVINFVNWGTKTFN